MKLAVVGTGMIVDLLGAHLIEWGCDVAAIVGTPNTMDRVNELVDDKRETSPIVLDDKRETSPIVLDDKRETSPIVLGLCQKGVC